MRPRGSRDRDGGGRDLEGAAQDFRRPLELQPRFLARPALADVVPLVGAVPVAARAPGAHPARFVSRAFQAVSSRSINAAGSRSAAARGAAGQASAARSSPAAHRVAEAVKGEADGRGRRSPGHPGRALGKTIPPGRTTKPGAGRSRIRPPVAAGYNPGGMTIFDRRRLPASVFKLDVERMRAGLVLRQVLHQHRAHPGRAGAPGLPLRRHRPDLSDLDVDLATSTWDRSRSEMQWFPRRQPSLRRGGRGQGAGHALRECTGYFDDDGALRQHLRPHGGLGGPRRQRGAYDGDVLQRHARDARARAATATSRSWRPRPWARSPAAAAWPPTCTRS